VVNKYHLTKTAGVLAANILDRVVTLKSLTFYLTEK